MVEHSFQEVMRQWKRMCDTYTTEEAATCCEGCPMEKGSGCCAIYENDDTDYDAIDRKVMAWAKENPEPVYPTWGEWLEAEGVCFSRLTNYERIGGFSIPQVFNYQIDGKTAFMCGDKVNTPIPADMAEKLGVKPKEET